MLDISTMSVRCSLFSSFFFFSDPATTEIYTLSLHDALPILFGATVVLLTGWISQVMMARGVSTRGARGILGAAPLVVGGRSEEHTSELQSRPHLVCRLLLEKKKTKTQQ